MQAPQNPLGYAPLPQLLRSFAIPSILAMLVSSLYNIVDQIFIGNGVGYLANAATNVAYPLTTICMAMALLMGIGGAARFNLSLGAGDVDRAQRTVSSALCFMVVAGVVYAGVVQVFLHPLLSLFGATPEVLPYALEYTGIVAWGLPLQIFVTGISSLARADGSPRYAMSCTLLGAVINTILDPIFIFIFDWGVAGAAWATVLGQIASCIMALLYLPRFHNITLTRSTFRPSLSECRSIASLGTSNCLTQLALTFVQIVLNNSLGYYGALSVYGSDIPLATSGIVVKVNAILVAMVVGISQGSQPIISFNYGAKQYTRVRQAYGLALRVDLVISVIAFACFQLFPRQIIGLFGTGDALYFQFAVTFMRTYLFMVAVNCVQMLSSNFFSAIGKPLKGAVLALTRQVIFLIPLILILPLFWGIHGIMLAAPIADGLAFVTASLVVRRELLRLKRLDGSASQ